MIDMDRIREKKGHVALLVLAGCIGVVTAIIFLGTDGNGLETQTRAERSDAPTESLATDAESGLSEAPPGVEPGTPGAELETFSALEPATQRDLEVLAPEARAAIEMHMANGFIEDKSGTLTAIAEIALPKSGREGTILAIDGVLCAGIRGGLGNCLGIDQAAEGLAFSAAPSSPSTCGTYDVFGIMPDGIASLDMDRGGDGSTDGSILITSNVYEATLPPVRTVLASENEKVRVVLPLDTYAEMTGCAKPLSG